jgi:hypothetical protein
MVGVAQLVERKNVALEVAGSNPVTHPIKIPLGVYPPKGIFIVRKGI